MRRLTTTIGLLSTAALTVALVPSTIAATTASWPDEEWVNGTVGTSSFDCGTDTGYASTAFGRFLSGTLLGQDLDGLAALNGVTLDQAADGTLDVDPATAIDQGSAPPTATYTNPLNVDLLSGVVGLDLTGLTTGLPLGSAGAVNQYAQVSGYGSGAGASGLVTDSGGVGITPTTPDSDLPEPATIALSTFIPAVAGVTDAQLEVGAVAASSQLDWCAVLADEIWGVGPATGSVRDYGLAGLGLELDSPLVGGLTGAVTAGLPDIQAAIDSLLGTDGLISDTIGAELEVLLDPLVAAGVTGDVSLSGLDLASSVSTLLSTPLTDGVVTIDLTSPDGTVSVDLDELLGYDANSLNNLAPNTELLLNDDVVNALVTRIGALLDDWVQDVVAALTAEIREATLTIDVGVTVSILNSLDVVEVTLDAVVPLGEVIDGTAEITVDADALGLGFILNPLLAGLGLPTVTDLVNLVIADLALALVDPLMDLVTDVALGAVTTLGATLSGLVTPIVTALSGFLDFLPAVVSLQANVQPDQPGGDGVFDPADPATQSSAQYLVTALELELLAATGLPGGLSTLSFGTASVGPITAP
ncbi:choice-of-anchor G family protein [Herbiconiux sp.]|uniref:choice-of-anchor G family protein n=1 Tax=Herbiconiux sp. TaxID=1871186 RepID=UPI0025C1FB12|nr:choice-of-anchor G family protein [Herbiconiux sp.]